MRRIAAACLIVAMAVGLSGWSSAALAQSKLEAESLAQAPTGRSVTIQHMAFRPATVTVRVGGSVTWTNEDYVPHTVTFRNHASSGRLGYDEEFTTTFTQPGVYTYRCALHPSMTGTVIVR